MAFHFESHRVLNSLPTHTLKELYFYQPWVDGGGGGIRTPGRLAPPTVFKTAAIDHSATPPEGRALSKRARSSTPQDNGKPNRIGLTGRRGFSGGGRGGNTSAHSCPKPQFNSTVSAVPSIIILTGPPDADLRNWPIRPSLQARVMVSGTAIVTPFDCLIPEQSVP